MERGELFSLMSDPIPQPAEPIEIPVMTRHAFLVLETPLKQNLLQAFELVPLRPTSKLTNERIALTNMFQRACLIIYCIALAINLIRALATADGAW